MKYDILRKENSSISYKQITDLLHNSFQERLDNGMNFTCSYITMEEYINRSEGEGNIILVAVGKDSNALLGTISYHIRYDYDDQKYGYVEFFAISPEYKHCGLGTALLNKVTVCIQAEGGHFILSDTATKAKSSILCHKKCGYRIIGLQSYKTTNYYSYLMRKQISSPSPYHSRCYIIYRLIRSSIKTRLTRKKDGSFTRFGQAIHR